MTVEYNRDIDGEIVGYVLDGIVYVPMDEGNKEYIKIQEWIEDGNTPTG